MESQSTKYDNSQSDHSFWHTLMAIAFTTLMALAFYVSAERPGLIGMHPTILRYVAGAGIVCLGFLYFLITGKRENLRFVYIISFIFILPILGMLVISCIVWMVDQTQISYIMEGMTSVAAASVSVLSMTAAFYMFGKKSLDYTFWGAAAAVGLVAVKVIITFGPGQFVSEYLRLLLSFSNDTGPAMEAMEMHDLSQGLGVFLMYYLFTFKLSKKNVFCLILSGILFTLTLKRIAALAVLIALVVGLPYRFFSQKNKRRMLVLFQIVLIVFVYGYLYFAKTGALARFMQELGINLMGRDSIYAYYATQFELSPAFLGRGLRYVFSAWKEYWDTGIGPEITTTAHNEFMTYMIELGFFGFIFWLWSNTWYKLNSIYKDFGANAVTYPLMTVIYAFASYATDNTFFYYSNNVVMYLTIMHFIAQSCDLSALDKVRVSRPQGRPCYQPASREGKGEMKH